MIDRLLTLGLLSASIHWLLARSTIARPLWSRARGKLSELLRCPACSGFWIGLGLGALGVRPLVLDRISTIVFSGIFATILTPIFEGVLLWGLRESAIEEDVGAVPDEEHPVASTSDTITPLDRPAP